MKELSEPELDFLFQKACMQVFNNLQIYPRVLGTQLPPKF